MTYVANRVQDETETTGTGNITLSGTPAATYQALAAHGGDGSTFGYAILGTTEWEVGEGTIVSANVFSRAPADGSAGAATLVSFSAGPKRVITGTSAATLNALVALLATALTAAGAATMSNKRVTPRVLSLTGSQANPAINTDSYDHAVLSGLTAAITSFTTNLTGTPSPGDQLTVTLRDNGTARAITAFGASFEAGTIALPTTTVASQEMNLFFQRNWDNSKWRLVGQN